MGTKVYFECDKLVVEKNETKKTYPVDELRYKETCVYYKRRRGHIIDGRKCTMFLKLYHNNKFVAVLSNKEAFFDVLIDTYNLKVYKENERKNPADYFVHLKKPGNLIFAHQLIFWAVLMMVFFGVIYIQLQTGIKFYIMASLLTLIVFLDIYMYRKSKYKIYYDNEKIELRYTFKKKIYTFEQISDYKIYESVMNNDMEMINIFLDEKTSILINQEYENYNHFKKILMKKAFSSYMC